MANCVHCDKNMSAEIHPPPSCSSCATAGGPDPIPHLSGRARWSPKANGTFQCRACNLISQGLEIAVEGNAYGGHFCNARCAVQYAIVQAASS